MLKKSYNPTFTRPDSTMRVVLQSVENGHCTRREIVSDTRLPDGKVRSALYNLAFIGAVVRQNGANRVSFYSTPSKSKKITTAPCLFGVRSIFDVNTREE